MGKHGRANLCLEMLILYSIHRQETRAVISIFVILSSVLRCLGASQEIQKADDGLFQLFKSKCFTHNVRSLVQIFEQEFILIGSSKKSKNLLFRNMCCSSLKGQDKDFYTVLHFLYLNSLDSRLIRWYSSQNGQTLFLFSETNSIPRAFTPLQNRDTAKNNNNKFRSEDKRTHSWRRCYLLPSRSQIWPRSLLASP